MALPFKKRIKQLLNLLSARHSSSAALVLSSTLSATKSRDTSYPYRPDSNIYYLTGSNGKEITLFFSSLEQRVYLIVPPTDEHKTIWEGHSPNYKKLAKEIGAELVVTKDVLSEVKSKLKKHEVLYHQNNGGTIGFKIASELIALPYFMRSNLPSSFIHCDVLLEQLRLFKDSSEIENIKKAAAITNYALFETVPFITPLALESEIANTIDYLFRVAGGDPSFNTIVASGASASVLHYEDQNKKLKSGELLLIDCGSVYNFYAADISRTLPVNGHFNAIQKELYSIVLEAQKAAIGTAKAGVSIKKVHLAAARVITEGLVDLGVLKGKISKLLATQAYKPYFMHGIGHTLGLDVHDVGNLRDRGEGELQPGMVITIEPGVYFSKKTKHILPCGIRIEDDILIKRGTPEILSSGFPKEISELEDLINNN